MEEGFWTLLCIPQLNSRCIRCTQPMVRCKKPGTNLINCEFVGVEVIVFYYQILFYYNKLINLFSLSVCIIYDSS